MDERISWLLEGDPWVEYGTRIYLLGQKACEPEVSLARRRMLEHPRILSLIEELQNWPGKVLSSHRSAGQSFHKLSFLAEMGIMQDDPGMDAVIRRTMQHQDPEGPFQLVSNTPVHFGGSGEDTWAWALCDAPVTLHALVRFGLGDDPRVQKGIAYLTALVRDNGWPCSVSKELGKFRGPGKKDDPCPYATLVMLKLLASIPGLRDSPAARQGVEALLDLWSRRSEQHPYMFFMGTDFCKLKYPLVWYDILHMAAVLAQFPQLKGDPHLAQMKEIIRSKADADGRYTPESVWQVWKDWDFGQKKQPSRALTLQVMRILEDR
jgi:hypothetical protein